MKNVDTVTPLDGDGRNVIGAEADAASTDAEDYKTKGRTTVATRRGFRFRSANEDLPVVTHAGIKVTREEANALVEESSGLVSITSDNENKED